MTQVKTDMVKIDWFEAPTQVSFYKTAQERWLSGIGYRDEIICAECGHVIKLKDMYDLEVLDIEPNPVRVLKDWIDFSEYIGS